jgi:antitoxin HigA-1
MPSTSKSSITINPDWLHNSHAGELLLSEFMEPLGMDSVDLARAIGVDSRRVSDVIEGKAVMDADLDLRLARYFRMSEGFFLALQLDHELLNARRALNGELDRIVPRAA